MDRSGELSPMVPIGLLIVVLMNIITALSADGGSETAVWGCTALAAILVAVIYIVHWIQYKALYIAVYGESAKPAHPPAGKAARSRLSRFSGGGTFQTSRRR